MKSNKDQWHIEIQVDYIKTFFKSIFMDVINEVVDKEGSLGGFVVHFDKSGVRILSGCLFSR